MIRKVDLLHWLRLYFRSTTECHEFHFRQAFGNQSPRLQIGKPYHKACISCSPKSHAGLIPLTQPDEGDKESSFAPLCLAHHLDGSSLMERCACLGDLEGSLVLIWVCKLAVTILRVSRTAERGGKPLKRGKGAWDARQLRSEVDCQGDWAGTHAGHTPFAQILLPLVRDSNYTHAIRVHAISWKLFFILEFALTHANHMKWLLLWCISISGPLIKQSFFQKFFPFWKWNAYAISQQVCLSLKISYSSFLPFLGPLACISYEVKWRRKPSHLHQCNARKRKLKH